MNSAQKLDYAEILRERYKDKNKDVENNGELARAYAGKLQREAELESLESGVKLQRGDCTTSMIHPLLGVIKNRGGKNISYEFPWGDRENDLLGRRGYGITMEYVSSPGYREGEYYRLYVGKKEDGPVLYWDLNAGWEKLTSRGNFGKNWINGGNWRAEKISEDVAKKSVAWEVIMDTRETAKKIEVAKLRLQAANLRLCAAKRLGTINSYDRQGMHPIYPGQEMVCSGESAVWSGHREKELAEADLLEAQADAI